MAEPYKVKVTIKEITKNECPYEFKVGDTWLIEDGKTPEKRMCSSAYETVLRWIRLLRYGGEFPPAEDKDVMLASCPDSNVQVIYEVRRLRE